MNIETLGHASLLITDEKSNPILVTDPWVIGSTYWRSWWLQNYPDENKINILKNTPIIYITHEHSDHFHLPSLRLIGKNNNIYLPDLPNKEFIKYLNKKDYKTNILKRYKWHEVYKNVKILSIPLWNDDSILLIELDNFIIVNLNDAKVPNFLLKRIYQTIRYKKKSSILLSSYSPASIVNSFRYKKEMVSIKNKSEYVKYINHLCKIIQPDYFMPFASQAIFSRLDSKWANEYRVSFNDLKTKWENKSILLQPYSKLNLLNKKFSSIKTSDYLTKDKIKVQRITERNKLEKNYNQKDIDLNKLSNKLSRFNLIIKILFPKGIGFLLDNKLYIYRSKKVYFNNNNENKQITSVTIELPKLVLKEVLQSNHIGDIGISMFTLIHITKNFNPKLVYLLFLIITLDDYGHLRNLKNFFKWFKLQFNFYTYLFFRKIL